MLRVCAGGGGGIPQHHNGPSDAVLCRQALRLQTRGRHLMGPCSSLRFAWSFEGTGVGANDVHEVKAGEQPQMGHAQHQLEDHVGVAALGLDLRL